MDNIKFISIDETNIQNCHILNESNVPEVGTRALNEFDDLVRNSNFNQCVILNEEVIGFIICFQDTSKTKSFMYNIEHKNFNEFRNRVKDFMYIDRIAVDARFRNNGIASMLYEDLIEYSLQNNIDNLTAEINILPSRNDPSFKFHKKFKFIEIDTKKYNEEYEVSLLKRIL